MTIIIRIEHPSDGCGMFRSQYAKTIPEIESLKDMFERHWERNNPHEDGIQLYDDMYCAFDSMETFNALVKPEEVEILASYGYEVFLLEVTKVEKGQHQVCYYKDDIVEKKDITSLFIHAK